MSLVQSAVLGAVQGIAEFLPISSSAHLILVPWLLGWEEHSLTMDVALHIGTLIAVLIYYREVWLQMTWSLLRPSSEVESKFYRRLFIFVIAATIPGAVIGFFAEHAVETIFRSPKLIAMTISFMGILLWYCDRRGRNNRKTLTDFSLKNAILVGIAQGCAVVPGFSRSGTTIATGLALGLTREQAAHFSFYLSVPITLGAIVHHLPKMLQQGEAMGLPFVTGIAVSALVGWVSISALIKLLGKYSYAPFAIYRVGIAGLILFLLISGIR